MDKSSQEKEAIDDVLEVKYTLNEIFLIMNKYSL